MKSKQKISGALAQLRRIIDDPKADRVAQRVAYEVELAIRWVSEDTVGWPTPAKSALESARIIHQDLTLGANEPYARRHLLQSTRSA